MTQTIPAPAELFPARVIAMTVPEILDLFTGLSCPSLDELDGEWAGYPHLGDTQDAFDSVRRTALIRDSELGFWIGKAFRAGPSRGEGYNRSRSVGAGLKRHSTFVSSIGHSPLDGRPSVVLRYTSLPPELAQVGVYDEIRTIKPGLHLGLAATEARGTGPAEVNPFVLSGPVGPWVGPDA